MPSPAKSSLSATTPNPSTKPPKLSDYQNVTHPQNLAALKDAVREPCTVKPLNIKVNDGPDGTVPGFLHLPAHHQQHTSNPTTAAILLSGAGGGVTGPSSIYLSMADKLASLSHGLPVLRLDYRFPARNSHCVRDVLAAMSFLEASYSAQRFVLVGWSFGGAPVFSVGGADLRVVGCATVASQTAETEGIRRLAPRPVLLLHGTGDRTLSAGCSRRLYEAYGGKEGGERRIELFEGDDHALTGSSARAEELLCEFVMKCAGVGIEDGEREVVRRTLVDEGQKVETMRKGGDLRGEESVE